ncbi:FecR family protein [Flavobacterium sp. XN-5]|uniref:FecR family protein n=1 Tax=Flavobacterium sp. XN-5 TaxID=2599390 RepID=UPI0011CA3DBB|nr:FecR domain-containing protein [Flavobacterium sp. XN-5]NGY37516.1 FecR family protein [Flavobacterium sp. XN-5]
MMTLKKAERLIVKFITNQANLEEIQALTEWLDGNMDNQMVFKDFVKTNYAIDYAMNTFDSEATKKDLLQKIREENNVFLRRRFQSYLKYAAVLVIGLSAFYFYQNNSVLSQNDEVLIPREELITLQSDNGEVQVINPATSASITNKFGQIVGKQDKNKIMYSDEESDGVLAYNTIKIPYGKRFQVALSDGTIVHLNSGTTLKYPVRFLKNQNRQVFLTGEAFFEVAKDKAHPFTVNTQEMNVEVLGTKFNMSSYPEDVTSEVVLVEGSVGLYKDQKTTNNLVKLTPGLKGSNTKGQQNIFTEKVNTDIYTAWVTGSLVFKNMPFDAIIKKLERHYNVTFINKNKTLGKEVFSARFDNEPIAVVLKFLNDSYAINYKIKDNTIIIQ